jgi:hypothetical protein
MTSRSTSLAVALLCGPACDHSSKPPDPAEAGATIEANVEAKNDVKAVSEGDAKPVPAPDAKPEPGTRAGPPSLTAGIDPPDQRRVLGLARAKGLARPALAAKLAEAGARRYIAAIRDRKGSTPAEYSLHLLLLRAPDSAPGAAVEWVADGVLELHRWRSEWLDEAGAGAIPTTLVVDDHERDGEIEVLVRFRHEIMCPGGGPNTITDLRIVELEPALAVVLKTELHHSIPSTETKGTAHHEDLDGDGHTDLRIAYSTKSEDEPKAKRAENRWRWVPGDDIWLPLTEGAKLPTNDRTGCDW